MDDHDFSQIVVSEEPVEVEKEEDEEEEAPDGMAIDEETAELLENGTMEQLAAIVLTGEGHRLIGRQSSNPELQAFIDNVPSYMVRLYLIMKIGNVHVFSQNTKLYCCPLSDGVFSSIAGHQKFMRPSKAFT